jgi:WXXGXW repeat (2 copies)
MKRVLMLRLCAGLVATGALGSCAFYGWPHWGSPGYDAFPHWSEWQYGKVAYAGREPPSSTPIEVIPDAPDASYVWVSGHWRWQNDDFEWVNGSWEKPKPKTHDWIPGQWEFDRHGWYYVDGRWQ